MPSDGEGQPKREQSLGVLACRYRIGQQLQQVLHKLHSDIFYFHEVESFVQLELAEISMNCKHLIEEKKRPGPLDRLSNREEVQTVWRPEVGVSSYNTQDVF